MHPSSSDYFSNVFLINAIFSLSFLDDMSVPAIKSDNTVLANMAKDHRIVIRYNFCFNKEGKDL